MSIARVMPRVALAGLLGAAIVWAISHRQGFDVTIIEAKIRDMGAWAPIAYAGLYVAATVLFFPGWILGLAGGALFGPILGAGCTLLGATFGATLAFLAARYVASDWVAARADGRLRQLITGVEEEGWRFVAFARLVPVFPFNLLNYALGLTRIRVREYVLASVICMAPGVIAYTYLGYAGREAFAGGEGLVQKGLVALGLLALAAFAPRLARRLRAGAPGDRRLPRTGGEADRDVSWVEAPDLADRLHRKPRPVIIDVRGADEFDGELGHIEDAMNISIAELPRRVGDLDRFKSDEVV
ncbi:MAG: VTT domain-containing protein, partial [Stellaceae bacterium]